MEGDVAVEAAEKDVVGEPVEFAADDVVAGHVVGVGVVVVGLQQLPRRPRLTGAGGRHVDSNCFVADCGDLVL